MTESLQRAYALLEIHRYQEAQRAAMEALAESPESVNAHLVMAEASISLDQYDNALNSANRAIGLAPNESECYLTRARIFLATKRSRLATNDCQLALQYNPANAPAYGVLAWCRAMDGRWRETLEISEKGLEVDPEESNCVNARARALLFLHEDERALEGIDAALARHPDDAYTHANAGWVKLQAGDRGAALNHFTEALRREPDFEVAREGLIASIKASSPIYGALLAYTFFMTSLRPGMRLAIAVGAYIAYRITWVTLVDNGHYVTGGIIVCLWISLVLLTWAGDAIFNLLLMLTSQGRRILSTTQQWLALAVAATLVSGFSCIFIYFDLYLLKNFGPMFWIGIGLLMACMPLAHAGRVSGQNLNVCLGLYIGSVLLLILTTIMHFNGVNRDIVVSVRDLVIFALLAFSWVGPSILEHNH